MGDVKKEVRGAVIGTVVAAVVGGIIVWLTGVAPIVWGWLVSLPGIVWGWLWSTTPVVGWLLAVILFFAAIGTACVVAWWRESRKRPEWESFRAMAFEGVHWTWTWQGADPIGLRCFCPRDHMELRFTDTRREIFQSHNWRLICQKCQATFGAGWRDTDGAEVDAVFEIQRLIRTGEWRQAARVQAHAG